MRYALIDWDNTIHQGYTIYGLTDYLVKQGLVNETLTETFEQLKLAYHAEQITYADYTLQTCEAFANALAGCELERYRTCVSSYLTVNETSLFPDASLLFKLLKQLEIDVYLVSGAPAEVLRDYAAKFEIKGIYGFELAEQDGRLTGQVASNYGVDKDRVLLLPPFQASASLHLLSAGDAVADIPLLENARVPIIVGEGRFTLKESISPLRFSKQTWDLDQLEQRLRAELAGIPSLL
ncbi:HAD family hydrolase [Paenibacillus sinopodophylli]|uniref:HAD family hydrolase n=1 Tax=Paenibacillus sinopodophylli TaxID=1837342 RepID=UPI00110CA803|nr:HAD family hydrolase [Paenibacillus sinopodophylli]